MDNETQNTAMGGHEASDAASDSSAASAATEAPTMAELLSQSPVPCSVCDWIACMRKAGIALTYSLEKRHIPDMSRPDNTSCGGSASSGKAPVGSIDTMTASGTCRIRYFDLILGSMAILSACALIKCCCSMKRKMF